MIVERHITVSALVGEALERFLEGVRREKVERDLREGYWAYAVLSDQVHRDFEQIDAEWN